MACFNEVWTAPPQGPEAEGCCNRVMCSKPMRRLRCIPCVQPEGKQALHMMEPSSMLQRDTQQCTNNSKLAAICTEGHQTCGRSVTRPYLLDHCFGEGTCDILRPIAQRIQGRRFESVEGPQAALRWQPLSRSWVCAMLSLGCSLCGPLCCRQPTH